MNLDAWNQRNWTLRNIGSWTLGTVHLELYGRLGLYRVIPATVPSAVADSPFTWTDLDSPFSWTASVLTFSRTAVGSLFSWTALDSPFSKTISVLPFS